MADGCCCAAAQGIPAHDVQLSRHPFLHRPEIPIYLSVLFQHSVVFAGVDRGIGEVGMVKGGRACSAV